MVGVSAESAGCRVLGIMIVDMVVDRRICGVDGFFFFIIRRPPRSTRSRSSAASDVYKRQGASTVLVVGCDKEGIEGALINTLNYVNTLKSLGAVSYTHLRAHETPEHLVCRLLLEKKNTQFTPTHRTSSF